MNIGVEGYSELRSHHCIPAWAKERDPISIKKIKNRPGAVVAHACNPRTLGGQVRQITRVQEFQTSLANTAKPPSLLKIQKISQAW